MSSIITTAITAMAPDISISGSGAASSFAQELLCLFYPLLAADEPISPARISYDAASYASHS